MSTLTSRLHHDVKTQHYRDIQELVQDVRVRLIKSLMPSDAYMRR